MRTEAEVHDDDGPQGEPSYTAALARARKQGVGRCDDAAAMASFCSHTLQLLVGAVSPQLVWEGAQRHGLTFAQLAARASEGWRAVDGLQWGDSFIPCRFGTSVSTCYHNPRCGWERPAGHPQGRGLFGRTD